MKILSLIPRSPLSIRLLAVLALVGLLLASAPAALAQSAPGFSKAFSESTIGPGSTSTLTFTINNPTSTPIRGLTFSDSLPAAVTIASPAKVVASCQGSVDAPNGGSTITYSDGTLGANRSCTIKVNVTSSTPGTHTNVSGDLTSDAGNSGSATADLTVATDRPGFTKSFSPSSVFFGQRSTLTFTINNTANTANILNVSFSDTLPVGMTVASPSNAAKTCSGGTITAPPGGNTISYSSQGSNSITVAAGASCTIRVDVNAGAVGELGNTSGELTSVSSPGFALRSSGKASAVLSVSVASLALTKSFLNDPVAPGETVTLRFTVRNLDRRSDATDIAFTDDLDAVLSGLVATGLPLVNPCGSGSTLTGTDVISLAGGNLPAEGSCTFSVTLQVPATADAGEYSNVTSTITADVNGDAVAGNPATDILVISPSPALTKTFLNSPVGSGDSTTLEFTLTNTSPDFAATDISFQDIFNIILQTASSVPADDFCGVGSTATFIPAINPTGSDGQPARLEVSGASLAAGASCTFSITLNVVVDAEGGTYPNTTSEVSAIVNGEEVTGNPATDSLDVVSAPTLLKEFTDDPVAAGDTVTLEFTLTHSEDAAGTASNISFTDDLDAALSGLVATGLPMTDVCGISSSISGTQTLSFTGGSLAPGESCTFSVTLQTPASASPGPHTNTTSTVTATVLGLEAMSVAASDDLDIAGLTLTKEFTDDPALPGSTVTLRFTVSNESPTVDATNIFFRDDLDDTLPGLVATGLPMNDICGTGSSLSGSSGNSLLTFQGGSLAAGTSCSFDVTLQVPASAEAGAYANTTSLFMGTLDGQTIAFDNATDDLVIETNFLALAKEFTDDPVGPGENVTLQFTITNVSDSSAVEDIAFTDDLEAALSGLVNAGGTLNDICGIGSQLSGSSVLSFTGGSLAAGSSCTFNVTLAVPSDVELGTTATNTTSAVTGNVGGLPVDGNTASDTLEIDFVEFSKSFSGVATAGGTVTLTFNIANQSNSEAITDLSFTDDLNAVLTGLTATGLPMSGICGEDSLLTGTTFLSFTQGSLLPGGSCTFSVVLQVPATAATGMYVNATSNLRQGGRSVAQPATASLAVVAVVDADGDGVLDGEDLCPGTVIPEGVPTDELKPNRYALVDGDFIFDTQSPPGNGNGPGDVFTTTDTAGCSCEQIIEQLGLGKGHEKFGCSVGAMRTWVGLVSLGFSAF